MARFDDGWCQFPREVLEISKRDPYLRALVATLCAWATPPSAKKIGKAKIGQVLTSDQELADELGCERKTISRKLKKLAGFVTIERDGKRGRIISLHHLVPNVSRSCPDDAPSQILEPQEIQTNRVSKLSRSCPDDVPYSKELRNKNKNREREGGDSRAHEEGNPPPNQKINSQMNSESDPRETRKPPWNKNILPIDLIDLSEAWLGWASERAPDSLFSLQEFYTAISEIQVIRKCTTAEIRDLFEFVKIDPKLSQVFLTPTWHSKLWGGMTILTDAWMKKFSSVQKSPTKQESDEQLMARLGLDKLKTGGMRL